MALWRFLICFLSLLCGLVAGQTTKYGLLGQTAIFNTGIKTQPDDILWKHNENKVVEFDGSEQLSFGSFEDRVHLDWHSADLTISNLRYEDSGLYELQTFTNNKINQKFYNLKVIGKVVKPTISCEVNKAKTSEQSGDEATLTCSLSSRDPQSLLTFQWSSNTNVHPGAVLNISLRGEDDDQMYNCAVRNPLSEESTTFSAKDCYAVEKSQAGLIAGILVAVLLLLLIALVVGICIAVKRNNQEKTDEENHLPPEQRGRKNHLRTPGETLALMKERRKNIDQNVYAVKSSDNEERPRLLHRESTMPSKQTLGHLHHSNDEPPNFTNHEVKSSDNEERRHLLHRESTMPSKQTLGHLHHSNDEPPNFTNHEEKNKNEHDEISFPSPAPEKPPRTFSERHAKEDRKSCEGEPEDAVEEEPSDSDQREENAESSVEQDDKKQEPAENLNNREDDPADSEETNDTSPNVPIDQNDKKQEPAENMNNKEDDPADSEETNNTSPNVPNDQSPEKPIKLVQRSPSRPQVAPKPKIRPKLTTGPIMNDENMPANVNKEQSLETDPAGSVIATEEPATASDNQNDKKKEPAENLNNKEDDPADSEETKDTSANVPNDQSSESATNEGNDPPNSQITAKESAAATSDNQNSENKKEENESAKPTSDDDVQPLPAANENSPLSQSSP